MWPGTMPKKREKGYICLRCKLTIWAGQIAATTRQLIVVARRCEKGRESGCAREFPIDITDSF